MKFTEEQLNALSVELRSRLSEKRYMHTLAVRDAALKIGSYFTELDLSELSAAALLHDVTKELTLQEQIGLFEKGNVKISDEDKDTPAILHSLSAPIIVKRDFPEFATPSILSAVEKHTTGDSGMTLFDKIIFIADYVEETRAYEPCIKVRQELYAMLSFESDCEKNESAVNKAVYDSLCFTENDVLKRGRALNSRSVNTIKCFRELFGK